MRRRQAYAAQTAAAEAAPQPEVAVPDKRPEKQAIKRPPVRRAAKPK